MQGGQHNRYCLPAPVRANLGLATVQVIGQSRSPAFLHPMRERRHPCRTLFTIGVGRVVASMLLEAEPDAILLLSERHRERQWHEATGQRWGQSAKEAGGMVGRLPGWAWSWPPWPER
jgi:hypothetical protein